MSTGSRWKRLFRLEENGRHLDANIDEEFRFHIEELVERLVDSGLTEEEARKQALRRFGDSGSAREGCRDLGRARLQVESFRWALAALARDLRIGLRLFRFHPGFTAVVVICLTLGIGATTSVFSVLHAVVLKHLPFPESERLVMVWETFRTRDMFEGAVSYPNLDEWRRRNQIFEGIGAYHPTRHTLTGIDLPERIMGGRSDAEFLRVLGVEVALGRSFLPEDDQEGAPEVVVITDGFWRRRLGSDAAVLGSTIELDEQIYTVIGVLPPEFSFPVWVADAEVWTSTASEVLEKQMRPWPVLIAVGRLQPGIELADAQAHMDAIGRQLEVDFPETNTEHGFNLVPLQRQASGRVRSLLYLLQGAVILVLLIACANVANLMLARSGERRGQLAVRAALGAGRGDLVRQMLTEGILLSLIGGGLGILVAIWGTKAMVSLIPAGFPRLGEIGVSGPVLLFTAGVSMLTGVVFGLVPALQASRVNPVATLGSASRHSAGRSHRLLRRGLIVIQSALALVLLAGAGLLIRSFGRMLDADPGFDPENVITFAMAREWSDYDPVRRGEFYLEMPARLESLPGVVSAGAGTAMPLVRGFRTTFVHEGQTDVPSGERPVPRYLSVSPTYFETLRVPLIRGRVFTAGDSRAAPGVAVVNQAAAAAYWPDIDPIGKRIYPDVDITDYDPTEFEVVGIVGDARDSSLDAAADPCIYVPCTQQTWPTMSFAVRTAGDPMQLAGAIRDEVASMTLEAAFSFRPLSIGVDRSIRQRRFPMLLLAGFAGLALILAAVGIYGVLSYAVVQRRREIGIRIALGARPGGIVSMILAEGMALAGIGVGLGLIIALALSGVIAGLLFEVTPSDPGTLARVALLMLAVALSACYLPVLRASRVDPVETLKAE